MARHARTKSQNFESKKSKFNINIKHLLVVNIALNLAILYFIKFS